MVIFLQGDLERKGAAMRLMVGQSGGGSAVYGVLDQHAVNFSARDPALGADLGAMIKAGVDGLARAKDLLADAGHGEALGSITPALPLQSSGKIICLGLNYVDHAKEGGYDVPDYPALFMRGMTSMLPAEAPIIRPRCSERLDYEAELIVIIGEGGRYIDRKSVV